MSRIYICITVLFVKNINTIGTPSLKALIAGKYQDGGKKCVDKKKEIKKNSVNVTKK